MFSVPICYYFVLENCNYRYNEEKIIVKERGFNKKQFIAPLYRIKNITVQENIFKYSTIYIYDKGQTVILKYCKNPRVEMLKLVKKWEKAKNKM